nr:hypothetical protein Q903MT_gene303 [Picea sitchensis]
MVACFRVTCDTCRSRTTKMFIKIIAPSLQALYLLHSLANFCEPMTDYFILPILGQISSSESNILSYSKEIF